MSIQRQQIGIVKRMMHQAKVDILVTGLLGLLLAGIPLVSAAGTESTRQVLYLSSVHYGDAWGDGVEEGIRERVKNSGKPVQIFTEYLDTRRFPHGKQIPPLLQTLSAKYTDSPPDVMIVSDNPAFDFATRFRPRLFPGVPIVFCGYNDYSPGILDNLDNITGVVESPNMLSAVEMALTVHPDTRTLAFVMSSTAGTSFQRNINVLEQSVIQNLQGRYKIIRLKDLTFAELKKQLVDLPSDALLFLVGTPKHQESPTPSLIEHARMMSAASPVPTYTFWDFALGYGIIGGRFITGADQGRAAADLALRVLDGESASTIPVITTSPTSDIFDFPVMQRFNIQPEDLPPGAVILNRPFSFWSRYRWQLVGIILLLVLESALITLLLYVARGRRIALREISALLDASKAILILKSFEEAARKIFDICRELIGAQSGYVALLSEDGAENEVLFLEAGGLPCDVNPELPMPIRGLREVAYKTSDSVYDNNLAASEWARFMPEGHVVLKNVLFAPLNIKENTVGLIGLANKPGGFTNRDAELSKSFGDMAAVALNYVRYQDELRESETQLQVIFDNAPAIMLLLDENTEVIKINQTGLIAAGKPLDQVRGLRGGDVLNCINSFQHPKGCGYGVDCQNCVIRKTVEDTFATNQNYFKIEAELKLREDENVKEHVVLISTAVVSRETPKQVLVTVDDITDRKQMEETLRRERDLLNLITMTSPVGIAVVDINGKIVFANKRCEAILGLKKDQIAQLEYNAPEWRITDFDGNPFPEEQLPFSQVITTQAPVSDVRHAIEWPDGHRVLLSINAAPLLNEANHLEGVVMAFDDITERMHSEKQIKDSLKEKQTLLDEIHHRVKNNMNVIASLLKLQLNKKRQKDVDEILKENIGRVYSMAAIHESLHQSEKLTEIDFKAYLNKLSQMLSQTYSVDPGKVAFQLDTPELKLAIDQANPLGLVLNELISNSLKYAFPDGQKGIISIESSLLDDKAIELIVADDGIGMPDGFDWRKSDSLGLKLVKNLVENQLGGVIDLDRTKGAKFTIKFNLESNYK
ncbi:PAS domain S-box protein [bacterium]|nr:PAS domain S-box protein [bacterium]